ncbi:MAG: hypothetical protein HZA90_25860 [Verrucomicrobia bacterium]|nr:hypothetical protein [Verrucomicrobiota bacterium]
MDNQRPFNLKKLNIAFDGKKAGMLTRAYYHMHRARVPGGWLVVVSGGQGMGGITFYPDPRHEWDGGTLD